MQAIRVNSVTINNAEQCEQSKKGSFFLSKYIPIAIHSFQSVRAKACEGKIFFEIIILVNYS